MEAASGFVDGDLIETTVAELPREKLQIIIEGLKLRKVDMAGGQEAEMVTPHDVLKLVEDLAQIH
jgi:hypothetical protein